nr:unnamed protein product [Digitaria exilis]
MSGAAASRRASSAATAKRPAVVAAESAGGVGTKATRQANKRAALGDVTNVAVEGGGTGGRAAGSRKVPAAAAASKVNSAISAAPVKKVSSASSCNVGSGRASAVKSASAKSVLAVSRHDSTTKKHNVPPAEVATVVNMLNDTPATALCNSIVSPPNSEDSVSIDGTMLTCNSTESPDFECSNNGDSTMLASLEEQANEQVHILENRDETTKLKKNAPDPMEIGHICAVENKDDPQFYPTLASDIYTLLREAESEKRPSTDFMVTIQKDITPSMRAILIDWLVEVAEEYHLVPDTLYLTVNYIDRYLSGNKIGRQRLQLLGVACMLIAAKHEEICAPQAEEFCYITDNSYFRDEVLEMEAAVLKCLNFQTRDFFTLREHVMSVTYGRPQQRQTPPPHASPSVALAARLSLSPACPPPARASPRRSFAAEPRPASRRRRCGVLLTVAGHRLRRRLRLVQLDRGGSAGSPQGRPWRCACARGYSSGTRVAMACVGAMKEVEADRVRVRAPGGAPVSPPRRGPPLAEAIAT